MPRFFSVRLLAAAALLALVGCEPLPEKDDPIAETKRMMEEAKRTGRTGKGNNVFVTVERLQVSEKQAAGLGALWRYTSGRLSVQGGNRLASGGVRVAVAGPRFEAQLNAYARKARSASRTRGDIRVLSGAEGYLWVGRSVVVPVLRVVTASGEVVVLRRVRVGTSLLVKPRILASGKIELELAPSFRVLSGARAGRTLSVTAMRTRVVLDPGRKLVLGSSSSAKDDSVAAGLFGYNASGKKSATIITVSAERL